MVDLEVHPPNLAAQWMMGNLATLLADLGDRWPKCAGDLTDEVSIGLRLSESLYNLRTAAAAEELRIQANEEMARAFEQVDLIIAATNPGPAFPADATTSSSEKSFLDSALASGASKRWRPPCSGRWASSAPSPTACRRTCSARRPSGSPTS